MAPADDLAGLLQQLEGARTPLERLRRVALAWREVRRLNREEREQLATHLGLEEAGSLLERLAVRRGGLAPAQLLRAVRAAQQADPRELQRLFHGLADPSKRRATVIQGLSQLDERLAREAAGDEEQVEPGAEGAEEGTVRDAAPTDEGALDVDAAPDLVGPAEAAPQVAVPPPAPPATAPPPALSSPPPPGSPRAPAPVAEPAPVQSVPAPAPRRPTAGPGRVASHEVPEGASSRPVESTPPRGQGGGAGGGDLADELAATVGQAARLGRLRAALAGGEPPDDERLAAGLEAFPDGWARRRALVAMLDRGLPADAGVGLELVALLTAERDRAWCLAVMARNRRLPAAVLAAAEGELASPALRRRLERLATS